MVSAEGIVLPSGVGSDESENFGRRVLDPTAVVTGHPAWKIMGGCMASRRKGLIEGEDGVSRCFWPGAHADYVAYHDDEWGRPVGDDIGLFEKLCLEGFQSGLSWLTILRKRENFRAAFAGFDFERIARWNSRSVERLVKDAGIVRHRGKIESVLNNARRTCDLVDEVGSLSEHVWNHLPKASERPRSLTHAALMKLTRSQSSEALSRDLKRRGFSFVGPTTLYAFMQSEGIVNDHLQGCDFRAPCEREREAFLARRV
jgi:DNA-3-methyladenine glycosylase I